MNILVTGGAGFIGSHVVDAYVHAGHRVTVVDNFITGRRENLHSDAELAEIDIRDRDAIEALFARGGFDLVNHHAAQLDVRVSVRDPQFDAGQNIIGSLNILESARRHGVMKVIFASSGGTVYGEQKVFPTLESFPTDPISPYGVAKLSIEKYLGFYRHEYGIHAVALRYTNVYGPRQNPHGEAGVVAIFLERMKAEREVVINGDGRQTRDYVYVGDVARANQLALGYVEDHASGTFNIATCTETTVNELFALLNELLGGRASATHGPAQQGEQLRSVCSFAEAQRHLGWEPRVALREGLVQTVAW